MATPVATLVLDRPEKLNAWSWEASRRLARLAARVRFDDRIRVLVLRGAGRAFRAGVDLGLPEDRITGRSEAERAATSPKDCAGCTSGSGRSRRCRSRSSRPCTVINQRRFAPR